MTEPEKTIDEEIAELKASKLRYRRCSFMLFEEDWDYIRLLAAREFISVSMFIRDLIDQHRTAASGEANNGEKP